MLSDDSIEQLLRGASPVIDADTVTDSIFWGLADEVTDSDWRTVAGPCDEHVMRRGYDHDDRQYVVTFELTPDWDGSICVPQGCLAIGRVLIENELEAAKADLYQRLARESLDIGIDVDEVDELFENAFGLASTIYDFDVLNGLESKISTEIKDLRMATPTHPDRDQAIFLEHSPGDNGVVSHFNRDQLTVIRAASLALGAPQTAKRIQGLYS
jgi:hypothetical protein